MPDGTAPPATGVCNIASQLCPCDPAPSGALDRFPTGHPRRPADHCVHGRGHRPGHHDLHLVRQAHRDGHLPPFACMGHPPRSRWLARWHRPGRDCRRGGAGGRPRFTLGLTHARGHPGHLRHNHRVGIDTRTPWCADVRNHATGPYAGHYADPRIRAFPTWEASGPRPGRQHGTAPVAEHHRLGEHHEASANTRRRQRTWAKFADGRSVTALPPRSRKRKILPHACAHARGSGAPPCQVDAYGVVTSCRDHVA